MKDERIIEVGARKGDSYPIMVWIDDELKYLNCDDAVFLATELLEKVSDIEGGNIWVHISPLDGKCKLVKKLGSTKDRANLDDIFFWFALVICLGCLALLAVGTFISYFG